MSFIMVFVLTLEFSAVAGGSRPFQVCVARSMAVSRGSLISFHLVNGSWLHRQPEVIGLQGFVHRCFVYVVSVMVIDG